MVAFFEDSVLGSAFEETRVLGLDFLEAVILKHCVLIEADKIDYLKLKLFTSYRGVEMFHAAVRADFAIFAVEVDLVDEKLVTIMYAGVHGAPVKAGQFHWNGFDYGELITNVIIPRAKVCFT